MKTPLKNELIVAFETAIWSLVRRFRIHPYAFYTETDTHGYLYHRLYKPPFNVISQTSDAKATILLHEEFPTISKYVRNSVGHLETDDAGRRRGHLDISIWDPALVSMRKHRQQRVLCAAELALDECGKKPVHIYNDATKLADPANEIERAYLLFYVRDKLEKYKNNKTNIEKALTDAAVNNICVVIATKKGIEKWGPWGEF